MLKEIVNRSMNYIRICQVNKKYICDISLKSIIDKASTFEGRNIIYGKTSINQSNIGFMTYISTACFFLKTKIGKYCSIGPNVKVIAGNHPTSNFVSTHPVFYTNRSFAGLSFENNNTFKEYSYTDESETFLCEIGNDVWIGQDAILMNGIKVGDGAIIASGAVVTKNVPEYSIVGGIPAKVIRFRFNKEEIEFIRDLQWWNKSEEWIKLHVKYFYDVVKLRKELIS